MSLTRSTAAPGSTEPAAAPAPSAPAGAGQFFQSGRSSNGSFDWLNAQSLNGLSRAQTSGALTTADNALTEALKGLAIADVNAKLIKVDNTRETHLRLSGLVLALSWNDVQAQEVSFHTIILEGSADPLTPRVENLGGQTITIDRYTQDAFDDAYLTTVAELVNRAYPGFRTYQNSGTVVPRTFNWEDKEAVRQLLVNVAMACMNGLVTRQPGFADVDITKFPRNAALQTSIAFHQNERTDYVGQPVRSDIALKLAAVALDRPNTNTVNNQEREITLAQAGGFIDLAWAPMAQSNAFGAFQQTPTQKFVARLVLTSLEAGGAMTIAAQLLALIAAYQLGEGTNWFPNFLPRHGSIGKKGVDMKDIGAINIEANVYNEPGDFGRPIDTKSSAFTPQEQGKLLVQAVRPGLAISLDVSQCGTDTWYNEVFSAAASLHPDSVHAWHAILEAAQALTGGHFAQFYTEDLSPVFQGDDRVLLGYYTNNDGVKCDIRDLDYLAVMNLAGENPKVGADWSDTFTRTEYSIEKRLEARRTMTQNLLHTAVFTGTAQRVTFRRQFMEALVKGAAAAGLNLRTINAAANMEFQNSRGTASWADAGVLSPQASGLFTQGYAQRSVAGAARGFQNRWGG